MYFPFFLWYNSIKRTKQPTETKMSIKTLLAATALVATATTASAWDIQPDHVMGGYIISQNQVGDIVETIEESVEVTADAGIYLFSVRNTSPYDRSFDVVWCTDHYVASNGAVVMNGCDTPETWLAYLDMKIAERKAEEAAERARMAEEALNALMCVDEETFEAYEVMTPNQLEMLKIKLALSGSFSFPVNGANVYVKVGEQHIEMSIPSFGKTLLCNTKQALFGDAEPVVVE